MHKSNEYCPTHLDEYQYLQDCNHSTCRSELSSDGILKHILTSNEKITGIQGEVYIELNPWVFPTWLLYSSWSPCGLRIYTMESMDRWREIFSLACLITCISQLEGENFPDNWWMIILEVRSRIIRVWYYLVCNIPRQYFQNRVAIQHSFDSSKKDDTWFISKNQMQTNGRTSSPVYVSVVNSIKALSLGALPAE